MTDNQKRYSDFVAWNDDMIKKYDLEHYHDNANFFIRFIENIRVKKIIKFLQVKDSDQVIEIGCGSGDILLRIKRGKMTGVDISQYIIDIAKQRLSALDVSLFVGNAENLPPEITKNKYDKIFCSEVLEHLEDPQQAVAAMHALAKEDSIVVISIPNERLINLVKAFLNKMGLLKKMFPGISLKMDDEWHLHSFDKKLFYKVIDGKFTVLKRASIPFWFMPLRYVFKLKKI